MDNKLYVGNLSYSVTEEDLSQLFSQFGEVSSTKIITDRETGRSKGFAFVEMQSETDASTCVENLDGQEHWKRQLRVNIAQEKPKKPFKKNFRRN